MDMSRGIGIGIVTVVLVTNLQATERACLFELRRLPEGPMRERFEFLRVVRACNSDFVRVRMFQFASAADWKAARRDPFLPA
jgi:hypothetical protein